MKLQKHYMLYQSCTKVVPYFQLIAGGAIGENGEPVLRNVAMAPNCGFAVSDRSTFMVEVDAQVLLLSRGIAILIIALPKVNNSYSFKALN